MVLKIVGKIPSRQRLTAAAAGLSLIAISSFAAPSAAANADGAGSNHQSDIPVRPMPQGSIYDYRDENGVIRRGSITIRPMPQGSIYDQRNEKGIIHRVRIPVRPIIGYGNISSQASIGTVLSGASSNRFDEMITSAAEKHRLDVALIKAVIKAESNFNPMAVSCAGAMGLMQLMPGTAVDLNVTDAFHPRDNIDGGARYLRYLLDLYDENINLALAAYNAGEGAVAKYHNRIPPYPETKQYVRRVLDLYDHYRRK
ncbi:MAG TPA: lytic transglycosylase domain-containing protein [Smithellaceae bacterium]|nr:lytic transglycosylase domain-containing protein [Smithellaceae bacterium]